MTELLIPLRSDLDPKEPWVMPSNERGEFFAKDESEYVSWDNSSRYPRASCPKLVSVHEDLDGPIIHNSYLNYLNVAWGSHLGIVLSPDVVWYTLVSELAQVVKADPEAYRSHFTPYQGKTEILVNATPQGVIDMSALMDALRALVPGGLTELFLPEFSTNDRRAKLALSAAFADVASPYYSYAMIICGIPSVRMTGTQEDWQKLCWNWDRLSGFVFPSLRTWTYRVSKLLDRLADQFRKPDPRFMKMIFTESLDERSAPCSSPSHLRFGWWFEFYREKPATFHIESYPPHVANVNYSCRETGDQFQLRSGLFSSKVEDGFLVPSFGTVVFKKSPRVYESDRK